MDAKTIKNFLNAAFDAVIHIGVILALLAGSIAAILGNYPLGTYLLVVGFGMCIIVTIEKLGDRIEQLLLLRLLNTDEACDDKSSKRI